MAPQAPPSRVGGNNSHRGNYSSTSSHRHYAITPRNANTGAGVNRRAQRGHRGGGAHYRPGRATPGARLMDRITTDDTRLVDRMTGGGIRLADRITGGTRQDQQQPLAGRMSGGDAGQLFQREAVSHGYQHAARARPPRGRIRGGQGRGGGRGAFAFDCGGPVQGLGMGGMDGHISLTNDDSKEDNDNDNDNSDWELDLGVNSPNATRHSSLFLSSQPTQSPQSFQSAPAHPSTATSSPNFPTVPTIPTTYNPNDIPVCPGTSTTAIRLLNQPVSTVPQSNYQFVSPRALNNGNTYRGKDTIKKMCQNKKLAAILGGKPLPKERGVCKEEKMDLKM
ncbi:hypothetical protein NX059_008098 [Plenodomus lindquistii]|nr:hypothetical protein NX059_008098 [Plenodomus lindquistii]